MKARSPSGRSGRVAGNSSCSDLLVILGNKRAGPASVHSPVHPGGSMRLALAVLAFVLSCAAAAQAPSVQTPPVNARIADAAWLAGYWQGEGMGGTIEDLWM